MGSVQPMFSWCNLLCSIGCGVPCALCIIDPVPVDEAAGIKGGVIGSVGLGGIVGGFLG